MPKAVPKLETPALLPRFLRLWADPAVAVGAIALALGASRPTCYTTARRLGLPERRRGPPRPTLPNAFWLDWALARWATREPEAAIARDCGVSVKWLRLKARRAGIVRPPAPQLRLEPSLLPDGIRFRCQVRDALGQQCTGLYLRGSRCPRCRRDREQTCQTNETQES